MWTERNDHWVALNLTLEKGDLNLCSAYPLIEIDILCKIFSDLTRVVQSRLTHVMLNIFMYYTPPNFHPVNLQHSSC